MKLKTIILALLMTMLGAGAATAACDTYVSLSQDDLKEYRNKLTEQGADPLDQLFAFQQLVCSDSPTIRAYAIKTGLEGSTDPILREEIMLDALMDKTRIDIELSAGPNSTAKDKEKIKDYGGIFSHDVEFRAPTDGCISLDARNQCYTSQSLVIKGDKVDFTYNYDNLLGQFQLASTNELVGFVRYTSGGDEYGRMQAVIKLY